MWARLQDASSLSYASALLWQGGFQALQMQRIECMSAQSYPKSLTPTCAPAGCVQPVVRVRPAVARRVPGAADAAHRARVLGAGRAHRRAAHPGTLALLQSNLSVTFGHVMLQVFGQVANGGLSVLSPYRLLWVNGNGVLHAAIVHASNWPKCDCTRPVG